jgi:predicted MFS family arabinose efflux permease
VGQAPLKELADPDEAAPAAERRLVWLVAAIQLVNVLEFMIVMPLGPDFAKALGIESSHIAYVGGAYTAAAAVTGLLGALFLDRFDRRKALAVCMAGLVVATALGGFAYDLQSLVCARVLAGVFGGPATSLSLSIVADVVPNHRRGRAMAVVSGAFSVASTLGVPAGLELARLGGWNAPLFVVAGLAAVVTAAAIALIPPMRKHLDAAKGKVASTFGQVLSRPGAPIMLVTLAIVMISVFVIVPNLPTYLQLNGGFPRAQFHWLYVAGGLVALGLMAVTGKLVDRHGALPVVIVSAAIVSADLAIGTLDGRPRIPVFAFFVLFMGGTSLRGVALNALTSKVAPPEERARFQSAASAVQHLACAAGAFLSTLLLTTRPDGSLEGMERVGAMSVILTLTIPLLVAVAERKVGAGGAVEVVLE